MQKGQSVANQIGGGLMPRIQNEDTVLNQFGFVQAFRRAVFITN